MQFAERLNSVHKSYLVFEPNKSQKRLILGLILFCYLYGRRFTTANAKWRKQQKYVAGYWWPYHNELHKAECYVPVTALIASFRPQMDLFNFRLYDLNDRAQMGTLLVSHFLLFHFALCKLKVINKWLLNFTDFFLCWVICRMLNV